jgi:hypothetical protein
MFKQDSNASISNLSQMDGGPIDVEKILSGEETRTNIMVRHIPCRYQYLEIKQDFEVNHGGHWNELKLPTDNSIQTVPKPNRGYCFINFRHVLYVYAFYRDKKKYHWPRYSSDKTIDINFA